VPGAFPWSLLKGYLRNLHRNDLDLFRVCVKNTYPLTCLLEVGPTPMKSKLTLRLNEDLKERAKRFAKKRGTSVSKIVEHYFRILLREDSSDASSERASSSEDRSNGDQSSAAAGESGLSPRIRKLKEKLGKPAPEIDMDEDTRRWVEAAAEKHT